ncbi:MAG: diacylglycerol kinase family protein [Lachnospiraceae bacterium]|nr:diacylglycerol kinase family protein [Lachnospiraceae bacterium]
MIYVLYNPLANNGRGKEEAEAAMMKMKGDKVFLDIRKAREIPLFLDSMKEEDVLVISGGDGTLHHFANQLQGYELKHKIYFYPAGSGNDFCNDIEYNKENGPVEINSYLEHLPYAQFKGIRKYFLNNYSMGIDGYVCEKADEHRKRKKQKINYTSIALKGLAYDFKPSRAKITIDNKCYEFEDVWMAPTMKGRFVGGGMMVAPMQERSAKDHSLTLVVVHAKHRSRLLSIFPKIFEGKHVGYTNYVSFFNVKHAKVEFDRPMPVQIDGEVYLNVKEYEVFA